MLLIAAVLMPGWAAAEGSSEAVSACVAKGEEAPETFSATLGACLEHLSPNELAQGLRYHDAREALTDRVQEIVERAACSAQAQTASSAHALLARFARKGASFNENQSSCLESLSESVAGRTVLWAFVRKHPADRLRTEVMRALERSASAGHLSAAEAQAIAGIRKELATIDEKEARRRREEAEPDRVRARVANALRKRQVPSDEDLLRLVELSFEDRASFNTFLDVLNSQVPAARQRAETNLYHFDRDKRLPPFDRDRLRSSLLQAAAIETESWSSQLLLQTMMLAITDVSEAEGKAVFAWAEGTPKGSGRLLAGAVQAALADRFPELRPQVLAHLSSTDPDVAAAAFSPRYAWITAPAYEWVRTVSDEALKDERVQEQFLVFAQNMSVGMYTSARLPETRRAHEKPELSQCGNGLSEYYSWQLERWKDLKALGKDAGEEPTNPFTTRRSTWIPAAPPMTPLEATLRWQQFVLVRPLLHEPGSR